MPLLPVLVGAAVAALASQVARGEASPLVALAATLALAVASCALAHALARTSVPRLIETRGDPRLLRRYGIAGKAVWAASLGAYWLLLDAGGLASLARPLEPEPAALALVGPWVLACFGLWVGTFLGERAAFGGTARLADELRSRARRVLWPVVLFGGLALALLRVASLERVRELLDLHPHARPLVLGAGVLLVFAAGPLVLRALSPSTPFGNASPPLPAWLAEITRDIRYREWDLGFPVATASIAGLVRGARTVFVTPALRAALDDAELAAVVGHEVGHAALGHLAVRAAFATILVLVLDDASTFLEKAFPDDLLTPIAIAGNAILAATGLFVLLARRLEHDADLFAARGGPGPVVAALTKASRANGVGTESGGLLHPSPRARIELVLRAAEDPALAPRRLAVSRWLVRGVSLLAVATALLVGRELLDDTRVPLRDRLVRAAETRLEGGEPDVARGYVERALREGDDARALLLRARARPGSERLLALEDLDRARALDPAAPLGEAIERARIDLTAGHW